MTTVYIIFDPAGIWEMGEPVYATREAAQAVVDANPPTRTAFGLYSLRIKEYTVQDA